MKPIARRAGFSLIELLVVIGIIALLAGILIPVLGKLKRSAYTADTANEIGVLRSGIETYYSTFRAYPGPLKDDEIYAGVAPGGVTGAITQSENLVLGLVGGLSTAGGQLVYTGDFTGPRCLNPANPRKYEPFVSDAAKWLSKGSLAASPDGILNVTDTNVPEFMDRFPEPMPILYLRARVGASGIVSDEQTPLQPPPPPPYQYDARQYRGYIQGAKYYGQDQTIQGHNLAIVQNASPDATPTSGVPYDAPAYFKNPTLNASGTPNASGIPRCKDTYILIGAGPDRIFGTYDDITSFGSIGN